LCTPERELGAAGFVFAIILVRNWEHKNKKLNGVIPLTHSHTHTKYRVGHSREGWGVALMLQHWQNRPSRYIKWPAAKPSHYSQRIADIKMVSKASN
jgi:hypothetical protein